MEHNPDVKIGECFKKKGIVSHLKIKPDKKKSVHTEFGCMKVMVNLAGEVLERDRNGRQMELVKDGKKEKQWRQ